MIITRFSEKCYYSENLVFFIIYLLVPTELKVNIFGSLYSDNSKTFTNNMLNFYLQLITCSV